MKARKSVAQGPFGDFILRPPLRDTIFIATGTGIAPFRSMLQWLLADPARHQDKQFWLVFGNRTEKDIYYHEEFLGLAAQHTELSLSADVEPRRARLAGLKGICAGPRPGIVQGQPNMHAYVCGLDKMIKANRESLEKSGLGPEVILYEKYD